MSGPMSAQMLQHWSRDDIKNIYDGRKHPGNTPSLQKVVTIFLFFHFALTEKKEKRPLNFFNFINLFLCFLPLQDWQNDIERRKQEEGAATPQLHHDSPCSTPPASPRGATAFNWTRKPILTDWEEAELRPQLVQSNSS